MLFFSVLRYLRANKKKIMSKVCQITGKRARVGNNELPGMEFGGNIDDWKKQAGVQSTEGMANQMSMEELQKAARERMEAQRLAAMGKQNQTRQGRIEESTGMSIAELQALAKANMEANTAR